MVLCRFIAQINTNTKCCTESSNHCEILYTWLMNEILPRYGVWTVVAKTERKQFHLKISIRVCSVYAPSLNTCFGRNAYFIAGIGADSCEYMEVVSNFIAQSWSYRAKMASEIHSTHIMDRIRWMDGWRGRGVKSTWLTRLSASAVVSLCVQSPVICGWRRMVRG